jgi:O-antigen ligase
MQPLLENPLWILAGVSLLPLAVVFPWRWGWIGCVVAYAWADSSMPGGVIARTARFGVLALVVLLGFVRLRDRGPGEPPPKAMLWLFAWATLSLVWSADRVFTAANLGAALLMGIVAFHMLPRAAGSVEGVLSLVKATALCLLALLALGFVPGLPREELYTAGRLKGFFSNANGLGLTCALLAPWPLLVGERERGPRRVAAYGLVALLAGLAFLSGSRTGFGGVLIAVAVTQWLRRPSRVLVALAFLGFAFSVASLASKDLDLEEGVTAHLVRENTLERIGGRLPRWQAGLRQFSENPVFGLGFKGASRTEVEIHVAQGEGGWIKSVSQEGQNLHSQPLEALVDLGLLGGVLFLGLMGSVVARFRRLAYEATDPRIAAAAAAIAGTAVAVSADSFFHNWLLTPGSPYALVFWAFVGLGLRLERLAHAAPAAPGPVWPAAVLEPRRAVRV